MAQPKKSHQRIGTIMDPTTRLRIATRIHFALLRHYGEDVAVSTLLRNGSSAREALWVCEASNHDELVQLAIRFKTATRQEARAVQLRERQAHAVEPSHGATPHDLVWSRDTSGFGLSRPPEALDAPAPKSGSWLKPSTWLGRHAAR
jgi:hypothetical protein